MMFFSLPALLMMVRYGAYCISVFSCPLQLIVLVYSLYLTPMPCVIYRLTALTGGRGITVMLVRKHKTTASRGQIE